MKNSNRYSDAIHVMAYIALRQNVKVTSQIIANSVQVNPVTIRQITSLLNKAKLIKTNRGSSKIELSRKPSEISLLDIYDAVEEKLLSPDTDTNPECPIGKKIPQILEKQFMKIENVARKEMSSIKLEEIINEILYLND